MSKKFQWPSIYPIENLDQVNPLTVSNPNKVILKITPDHEILGDLSDMPDAGKQVARDFHVMLEGFTGNIDKTIPLLVIAQTARPSSGQAPEPMKFNRDRSFSGVRPCDEEKASAFWNACMDELERLAGSEEK